MERDRDLRFSAFDSQDPTAYFHKQNFFWKKSEDPFFGRSLENHLGFLKTVIEVYWFFLHIRNQHQKLRPTIYVSNLLTNYFFRRKTAFCLNSFVDVALAVPRSEFFDEKISSLKDSKHTWLDAVFDTDSEYVKKSIDFYNSFQKFKVVFQRSSKKPIFRFFSEKILLMKICCWVLAIKRWKPQVSISFQSVESYIFIG